MSFHLLCVVYPSPVSGARFTSRSFERMGGEFLCRLPRTFQGTFQILWSSRLRCKGIWYMVKHLHWWSRSPISESHGGDFGGRILHCCCLNFVYFPEISKFPCTTPPATQVWYVSTQHPKTCNCRILQSCAILPCSK